jgi:hypothetical protein
VALNTKIKINQSHQYDVPFVKSALNFTVLAQKLLSKKLLLLITIFIIMTLHFFSSTIYIIWRQKKLNILRHWGSFIMMKTLSLHMQANNGVSTNMGIVYVAPVQNKAGMHFMFAAPLITSIMMES